MCPASGLWGVLVPFWWLAVVYLAQELRNYMHVFFTVHAPVRHVVANTDFYTRVQAAVAPQARSEGLLATSTSGGGQMRRPWRRRYVHMHMRAGGAGDTRAEIEKHLGVGVRSYV